ncbi:MAG TPA: hypothetical protein VJ721_04985, partial [Chthoniobacterales bacterium]|nr:hypothetical protein [Chthoniobacterales bacterium]
MRLPVGLLILGLTVSAAFAAANPLTVKEISLMLRSGYSSATVLRELSARGFADIFDGDAEKQLAHAGANGEIIDALKNGKYRVASAPVLPPQPGAATFSQAAPNNDVSQFPRIPSVPSSGQTQQVAQPQPHPPTAPPEVHDSIYSRLKGDLVWLHQGSIVPFD